MWKGKYDHLFINGEWQKPNSTKKIEVISPSTEKILGHVPEANQQDVDRAVAAARQAFNHGPWPRMSLQERKAILRKMADQIKTHESELAHLVTSELGTPITLSTSMQAIGPRLLVEAYLNVVDHYEFQSIRRAVTGNALVTRVPIGVVAAIVPWNAPMLTTMLKIVPALLTGCTVVLKPAPNTPFDSYMLAEMVQAAGLPAGVLNIVPAEREVSEYLVTHADVNMVSFTGSTGAGRRIASLCGQNLRRVALELGGKSAAVILDDADFDKVVETLRVSSFRNSGQVCSNKTRVVVSEKRAPELIERLVALLDSMPVGDPFDPKTQIGPMVSKTQQLRVEDYIGIGQTEGARLIRGGLGRPGGLTRGWYVRPTLFADVGRKMRIAQEEIFGPVLAIQVFRTEEEAVAIANDSDYGLNGAVFAGDVEHGIRIATQIETGTVEINGNLAGYQAPMGGWKASGLGREGGLEGFDDFLETRSLGIPRDLAERLAG